MQQLPNQVALAAKHSTQTVCPNNPTGTARPWRAWLRTDKCSCSWEFATHEEGVAYLADQLKRSGLDLDRVYDQYDDRVRFYDTFLQHIDGGEVFSLADLGLLPLYWVEPPPPVTKMTYAEAKLIARSFKHTLSRRDGEFRVNMIGGREDTAYYTNDLEDAVATARASFNANATLSAGDKLRNGATVLAYRRTGDKRVVLCVWPRGGRDEYVTWKCDEAFNTYGGNYHQGDLSSAVTDFQSR